MNAFSTVQVFSRANWSRRHQPGKPGPVEQREASTNRNRADDGNTCFANIVLPYLDDAYTLAVWLTDNTVDAEDVVQDACLHAFRAVKGFAGGNARAWILTIVRHRAHIWLRKNRPAALVLVGDTEAIEPAPSAVGHARVETPEAALIAKSDLARLEAAIAALPSPFLETVVLREIQGLNYHEIAEVTEVPIGTVMSRLARGRRQLIKAIGRTDSRPAFRPRGAAGAPVTPAIGLFRRRSMPGREAAVRWFAEPRLTNER
jgi:RNA polymerase sigma-70 factor (ECF subfamily)